MQPRVNPRNHHQPTASSPRQIPITDHGIRHMAALVDLIPRAPSRSVRNWSIRSAGCRCAGASHNAGIVHRRSETRHIMVNGTAWSQSSTSAWRNSRGRSGEREWRERRPSALFDHRGLPHRHQSVMCRRSRRQGSESTRAPIVFFFRTAAV